MGVGCLRVLSLRLLPMKLVLKASSAFYEKGTFSIIKFNGLAYSEKKEMGSQVFTFWLTQRYLLDKTDGEKDYCLLAATLFLCQEMLCAKCTIWSTSKKFIHQVFLNPALTVPYEYEIPFDHPRKRSHFLKIYNSRRLPIEKNKIVEHTRLNQVRLTVLVFHE